MAGRESETPKVELTSPAVVPSMSDITEMLSTTLPVTETLIVVICFSNTRILRWAFSFTP